MASIVLAGGAWFVTTGARCNEAPRPAGPSATAVPARVAEPDGIVAEVFVAHPDRAWNGVQPLLATALGFRPVSLSATLTELLAIPAAYSPSVISDQPIVGVIVGEDQLRVVLAIRMRSGGELVAALTTGARPSHHAREVENGQVTVLEPQRRAPVGGLVIGVAGNSLLIASKASDLAKYGPFVARELPGRARATESSSSASLVAVARRGQLRGAAVPQLKQWWRAARRQLLDQAERQRRRSGTPDFAEPEAVVETANRALEYGFDLLNDAESVAVVVTPSRTSVDARLVLDAAPGSAAQRLTEELPAGVSKSLLWLPRETVAAVTFASTQSGRRSAVTNTVATTRRWFGDRLTDVDAERLEGALGKVGHGRGSAASLALAVTDEGPVLLAVADVADREALDEGLRSTVAALDIPALAEPLEAFVGRPRVLFDQVTVEAARSKVSRARIFWVSAPAKTSPLRLLWLIEQDRLYLTAGPGAERGLAALLTSGSDRARSLAADPTIAEALSRVDSAAPITGLLRPQLLGLTSSTGEGGPIVLSAGGSDGRLVARLQLDHAAMLAGVRWVASGSPLFR